MFKWVVSIVLIILLPIIVLGQKPAVNPIEIIYADNLRQNSLDDSTLIRTLAGNAQVKQGNTKLRGDSIVLNVRTQVVEVFGNVHIIDADTVHTYADYVKYVGKEQQAFLKSKVKLTDGTGTLTSNNVTYNIATGIATYDDEGKIVSGKTVLTSTKATYFSDIKDVLFEKNVHLTDPQYKINADSLRYNLSTKQAQFISPTEIKTKDGTIINTTEGYYNLDTKEASFGSRTVMKDSMRSIIADRIFSDDATGIAVAEGNAIYHDSANQVIAIGNKMEVNRKENSYLGTQKPVIILYDKDKSDSTFIAADTLYYGIRKKNNPKETLIDTIKNRIVFTDSLANKNSSDTVRYFIGYRNVRIYSDSMQAVCDSVYMNTEDSVFRLFYDPFMWRDSTQITGDTMYAYTKNKTLSRLYVFNNALVINKVNNSFFNQLSGKTLNAYLRDGNLNVIRMRGSPTRSIAYPQDETDSSFIGLNTMEGTTAEAFFGKKNDLKIIKYIKEIKGTLFPLNQVPTGADRFPQFNWNKRRRPLSSLELFE